MIDGCLERPDINRHPGSSAPFLHLTLAIYWTMLLTGGGKKRLIRKTTCQILRFIYLFVCKCHADDNQEAI